MRKTDQSKLDDKSASILLVARALFVERGYAATSMDDVALSARMSKTTLYTRYPSKACLFAAILSEQAQASGMEFEPKEFAHLSIDEALLEIGRRFVELACQPESVRLELVYHSEAAQLPEVATVFEREGPERTIGVVEKYFRDAARRGLIDVKDPRFATAQFLAAIKGTPFGISPAPYFGVSARRSDDHIRKIVRLFLDGARPRR